MKSKLTRHFSFLLLASFIYAAVSAQQVLGHTRLDGIFHMIANGTGNQNFDFRINDLTTDGGRFFIGANGNVGIGTGWNPAYKLHVKGGLLGIEGNNAITTIGTYTALGTANSFHGWIGTKNDYPFAIGTNDVPRIVVTDDGNVGIGGGLITAPLAKLHVYNGAAVLENNAVQTYIGTLGTPVAGNVIYRGWVGTLNSKPFAVGVNGQNTLVFDTDGEVGIGITDPTAKLHVVGATKLDGVLSIPKAATNYIQLGSDVLNREISAGQIAYQKHSDGLDILGAGTTGANSTSRKITLIAEGGVQLWNGSFLQLGFNTPGREASAGQIAYKTTGLEIYGAGTTAANRKINFLAAGGALFGLVDVGNYSMQVQIKNNTANDGSWIGTTSSHSLTLGANNHETMRITTGGLVGIGTGTSAPSAKLHVKDGAIMMENNSIKVEMTTNTAGDGGWFGTGTNHSLYLGANSKARMRIETNGNILMGFDDASYPTLSPTVSANYDLFVHKGVLSEDFALAPVAQWADHVFDNNYILKPLSEVEKFINANKHLPGIPSAEDVKKDGYSVKDINVKFLEKIEELTLYTIEQDKKNKQLADEVEKLKEMLHNK